MCRAGCKPATPASPDATPELVGEGSRQLADNPSVNWNPGFRSGSTEPSVLRKVAAKLSTRAILASANSIRIFRNPRLLLCLLDKRSSGAPCDASAPFSQQSRTFRRLHHRSHARTCCTRQFAGLVTRYRAQFHLGAAPLVCCFAILCSWMTNRDIVQHTDVSWLYSGCADRILHALASRALSVLEKHGCFCEPTRHSALVDDVRSRGTECAVPQERTTQQRVNRAGPPRDHGLTAGRMRGRGNLKPIGQNMFRNLTAPEAGHAQCDLGKGRVLNRFSPCLGLVLATVDATMA